MADGEVGHMIETADVIAVGAGVHTLARGAMNRFSPVVATSVAEA